MLLASLLLMYTIVYKLEASVDAQSHLSSHDMFLTIYLTIKVVTFLVGLADCTTEVIFIHSTLMTIVSYITINTVKDVW